MKTVYQQIQESSIPKEQKEQALRELKKICSTPSLSKQCRYIRDHSDDLSLLMDWSQTPSKATFWSQINMYLKMQNGKKSMFDVV